MVFSVPVCPQSSGMITPGDCEAESVADPEISFLMSSLVIFRQLKMENPLFSMATLGKPTSPWFALQGSSVGCLSLGNTEWGCLNAAFSFSSWLCNTCFAYPWVLCELQIPGPDPELLHQSLHMMWSRHLQSQAPENTGLLCFLSRVSLFHTFTP